MNTQYMKVNPNELVIDLPVDEAKVGELMESIKAYGLLQSPNVWLSGLRIIDGFHRVVACQRLGLSEIDCIVTDCNEEAFWDARIIAAKPHSSISGERLAIWMLEAWKASKWYKPVDEKKVSAERERLVFTPIMTDDLDRIALAEAIWGVDEDEALSWFEEKARKWGTKIDNVLSVLGFGFLERYMDPVFTAEGKILEAVDDAVTLSALEASALAFQSVHLKKNWDSIDDSKRIATEWILSSREGKKETLHDLADRRKAEERAEHRKRNEEARDKENRRYLEYAKTPAGKAEAREQQLAIADGQISSIFVYLENLNIAGLPEALRRLTSLISVIENKMEEAFPEHIKKTRVNPIIAENIELRKQVEAQGRKIESLERALKSKKAVSARLSDVVASSGHEIEMRN